MPEYEGREENQIEFTHEGGSANYISLDQVLMLAFQHARNNREIYGRFANTELVWALDHAQETEDFYDVRLSYRTVPARTSEAGLVLSNSSYPRRAGLNFGK